MLFRQHLFVLFYGDSMWHLVSDSYPEMLAPVLFIYEGVLYSGYYYEKDDDVENDSMHIVINVPDEDNTINGDSVELIHTPTHWMYVDDLELPKTIEENE